MKKTFFHTKDANNKTAESVDDFDVGSDASIWDELESDSRANERVGTIVNSRFYIETDIDDGLTGLCRRGIDLVTNERIAVKFAKKGREYALEDEYQNYLRMGADKPEILEQGIPQVKYYGKFGSDTILVMTLCGPSLYELRLRTKYTMYPIKTTLLVGIQAVDRLKYVHEHGLIFHDVKPTNFVIGGTNDTVNKVFLIDFGFSGTYLDENGRAKPRELTRHHHGTPEYMGLAPLLNYTQVRKDDLISLGLTLLDVHGVTLPWMELPELDDIWAAMASVLGSWRTTDMEDLCWKSESPETFVRYFQYLDTLNSQDTPDYEHLKHILGRTLTKQDIQEMNLGFTNWQKEPVRY